MKGAIEGSSPSITSEVIPICGRSVHAQRRSVIETFRVRYFQGDVNVAMDMKPGQPILGLFGMDADVRADFDVVGQAFHWGAGPENIYNARLETVDAKPMWRDAWADKSRMLIPVARFKEGRNWYAHKAGQPLAIAALDWGWSKDNTIETVMLTTEATSPVAPAYHRMPVLLVAELWRDWLGGKDLTIKDLWASAATVAAQELELVRT
jgi:putative SOS response-associated peptidase YedK